MKTSERKMISRGLDGVLSAEERAKLEQLRAENPDVRRLEQRWAAIGDQVRRVPVTPPDATVAWQDIRRAIRLQESDPSAEPVRGLLGRLHWAGALAGLVVTVLLGFSAWRLMQGTAPQWAAAETPVNRVEWVVAEIPGATTMIYTDTETDMTVIWMDVVQNVDPRDT